MKHILYTILLLALLAACDKDEKGSELPSTSRTVVVYIAGENNLSYYAKENLDSMASGSKKLTKKDRLIVYIDRANTTEMPYIAEISKGKIEKVDSPFDSEDTSTADAEHFYEVLKWCTEHYPADSYGLVLWGHADGWFISNDSIPTATTSPIRKAYGHDSGNNSQTTQVGNWMNIPSMAMALEALLPLKWKFIFCDCCAMQGLETAYELRNATEYLIASPAEIPGEGAPYEKVVPDMFDRSDAFYRHIIDDYVNSTKGRLPLSAIQTAGLPALIDITRTALDEIQPTPEANINMDGLIYYFGNIAYGEKVMYDIRDFIRQHATTETYTRWLEVFNRTVVYKQKASTWETAGHVNFGDFDVTEERFGGVSIFIPQQAYNSRGRNWNTDYTKMKSYYALGWERYGW